MTLDDAAAELVRARDAHRAAAAACEADWRTGRHTAADRFRAEVVAAGAVALARCGFEAAYHAARRAGADVTGYDHLRANGGGV